MIFLSHFLQEKEKELVQVQKQLSLLENKLMQLSAKKKNLYNMYKARMHKKNEVRKNLK